MLRSDDSGLKNFYLKFPIKFYFSTYLMNGEDKLPFLKNYNGKYSLLKKFFDPAPSEGLWKHPTFSKPNAWVF